jgi:membrane protease YdiL (CAAX protease family)
LAMFVTTCAFATMYWRSLVVQFKRIGFDHPAALVALLLLPVGLAVNYLYFSFLTEGLGLPESHFLDRLRGRGISELTLIFSFCVFPAVTEEIAFRGLVQHWLQTALHPVRALVFASFLFTVLHFSILSFPYLFGVGMLLGWAKWKTNSLYPSILIHFLHNYVVITYF